MPDIAQPSLLRTLVTIPEDGMAIMFPSKQEAMRAARTEWWRHVNGDPATNRSIKLQEAKGATL